MKWIELTAKTQYGWLEQEKYPEWRRWKPTWWNCIYEFRNHCRPQWFRRLGTLFYYTLVEIQLWSSSGSALATYPREGLAEMRAYIWKKQPWLDWVEFETKLLIPKRRKLCEFYYVIRVWMGNGVLWSTSSVCGLVWMKLHGRV